MTGRIFHAINPLLGDFTNVFFQSFLSQTHLTINLSKITLSPFQFKQETFAQKGFW